MLCICVLIFLNSLLHSSYGQGPITPHFEAWLNSHGYRKFDFPREDMGQTGSFGGKMNNTDPIINTPIVFVHGNSDSALQTNNFSTGWQNTVEYFLTQNYTLAEMYGTSWGNTSTPAAVFRYHDCNTVYRLRQFFDAVLAYTGASKLHIMGHSMGVTLARKVVQGGRIKQPNGGQCEIGPPLTALVDVFIGLAGANYGLCACVNVQEDIWPTCNHMDGLWPGDTCGSNDKCEQYPLDFPCGTHEYSQYLMDINSPRAAKDGAHVFSVWSKDDDLIGSGTNVWGRSTCEIPNGDGNKIYTGYNHMETKQNTTKDQYFMITQRAIPNTSTDFTRRRLIH